MDYQLGPGPLQVDQNTIDEKIKGDIGIVENGDVATHTIPSGYYVIWKGDLYIAKTNISSGTTLSTESNGNLTAKPNGLGGEVAALNSKLIWEYVDYVQLGNYAALDFFVNRGTKMGIIRFSGNQNPVPVGDTSFTIPSSVGNSVHVFVAPLYSNTPAFISVNQGGTGYIRFSSAEMWAAGMLFFILA